MTDTKHTPTQYEVHTPEYHALFMVRHYGFVEAQRFAIADRDRNSPGTFSYAFCNSVVKQMRLMASVGPVRVAAAKGE
jgi:hypothetical protein